MCQPIATFRCQEIVVILDCETDLLLHLPFQLSMILTLESHGNWQDAHPSIDSGTWVRPRCGSASGETAPRQDSVEA